MKLLLASSLLVAVANAQYYDRFNYHDTEVREDGNTDFEPKDWQRISCNENNDLDGCLGYPDKWKEGIQWSIKENHCRWCPEEGDRCGRHHQSPYNVKREVSLWGSAVHGTCIDWHWMKYEDSTCTMEELQKADAFTVERFGLRISQPITNFDGEGNYRLDCSETGIGRKFGRIDYSKGFSQWWFLSHIDFKIPSEHTQDGVRYDAEAQMYHWYSVAPSESGTNNEMGTVSVFMDVYDDAPPYRDLDRVICQWRAHEERVRADCNLPPIEENYGACFPNIRGTTARGGDGQRRTEEGDVKMGQETARKRNKSRFRTVNDLFIHNHIHQNNPNVTKPQLTMHEDNWDDAEEKDWEAFIQKTSDEFDHYENTYKVKKQSTDEDEILEEMDEEHRRRLVDGDEGDWFNYFLMLGVRTEYYFRVSGTQTIPPCYGTYISGTRKQTNHWRILKDPIRIHKRQLAEMQRLIRERVSPVDYEIRSLQCKPDTAAKVEPNGDVNVARPLQSTDKVNYARFCECEDWPSKWPEDRKWCQTRNNYTRFYENIYNFETTDVFDRVDKPPQY